jgi:transposase
VVKGDRFEHLQALLPQMEKQLKRKGMTILLPFEQYKKNYPRGYGITQFYKYFRYFIRRGQPVMHLEHKAGDKLYIDFAGTKLPIGNLAGLVLLQFWWKNRVVYQCNSWETR